MTMDMRVSTVGVKSFSSFLANKHVDEHKNHKSLQPSKILITRPKVNNLCNNEDVHVVTLLLPLEMCQCNFNDIPNFQLCRLNSQAENFHFGLLNC